MIGKLFQSVDETDSFYNIYSKMLGFSTWKKLKRKNSEGDITIRSWTCSNEGFREDKYMSLENKTREARAITRTGCEASFRIVKCKDSGMYKVKVMDYASLPHFYRKEDFGSSRHSSNGTINRFSLDHDFHQEMYQDIKEQTFGSKPLELIKQGSYHFDVPQVVLCMPDCLLGLGPLCDRVTGFWGCLASHHYLMRHRRYRTPG
ncbi:hypothetical protein Scep_030001 [Stephania cephalantha]|uniref:FAR1 domain-containing protein n=1 Tax=Stephania cephalantha TaxID=152367 RepID=A0AAP0DYQ6_9MAGN